jgi:hypothetical protein
MPSGRSHIGELFEARNAMQAAHAGASDASQKGDPKKNGWLLLAVGGYIRLPAATINIYIII